MNKIYLISILIILSACTGNEEEKKKSKASTEELQDSLSDGSDSGDKVSHGQNMPTEVTGSLPEVLESDISPDPLFLNSHKAHHFKIDFSANHHYKIIWYIQDSKDSIVDHLIKIEEIEPESFNLYTGNDKTYTLIKNSSGWILEEAEKGERYFLSTGEKDVELYTELSDLEYENRRSILGEYPKIITDREQMKEIIKTIGLSDDKLHDIHKNEDGSFYYDPCDDWTGHNLHEEFKISGSSDYTKIMSEDQPSFYASSQDTYAWKIINVEKIYSGFKFDLEGYNRKDEHYFILTSYGFWVYKSVYGGETTYKTTPKHLKGLKTEQDDCPDVYDVY